MSEQETEQKETEQNFATQLDEYFKTNEIKAGEPETVEILRIERNVIIVAPLKGAKSDISIPVEEFKNDQGEVEIQEGDYVQVVIEKFDNGYGQTTASRDIAKRLSSWLALERALEAGEFVTGTTQLRVRGGIKVLINGIQAFLPGSLIDTKPIKDLALFENKTMEFKVVKLDRKRSNVVVSRKAVVEASRSEERAELMKTMTEGQIVTGTVKNITDYGAFVDLDGIDGLLHITDLAWKRIRHPSEMLEVGKEVQAKILKFDTEKNRVSLGIKQMGSDPWTDILRRYPAGTRLFGKVSNLADYGAFIELEDGIEGLVHVSEMDWTNKNITPSKIVALGDEVEIMILEIDENKRRISLGMKQCYPNPWQEFAQNFKRGDKVKGPIRSITDFGLFIGLESGIDGLVHLSDLSWNDTGEAELRNYKKGQEVEAVLLGIEVDRERISLGIKQLDSDPFITYVTINEKGSVVTGKVKSVEERGAEIDLGNEVIANLRALEISTDRVEDATKVLKVGDEVEAIILNIDRKTRTIQISIKAKDQAEQQKALENLSSKSQKENAGTTNLGALLQAARLEDEQN